MVSDNAEIELSVVIPTCNRTDPLVRAIGSVAMQANERIEIVVVQDGDDRLMPAATREMMRSLGVNYVINKGAKNAANARNLGVAHARGEYITFLDDDDLYMPGRLTSMLAVMRTGKYVFVSSGRFYERGDFAEIVHVQNQRFGEVTLAAVKEANDIDIGMMLRRATFLQLGGFDTGYTNLEDWDFVIRLATLGTGFKIRRFDYCVNVTSDRLRVSDRDWIGHQELVQKFGTNFGRRWELSMRARVLRLNPQTTVREYFQLALAGRSLIPVTALLKKMVRHCIQ